MLVRLLLSILCLAPFCKHVEANQKIKAIVFDFGGVFATTNREEVKNFMIASLHISAREAEEILFEIKKYARQSQDEQNFWRNYEKAKNKPLPQNWLEQLNHVRFKALKIVPGMMAILKDLQMQGFRTALLSNVRENQAQIKSRLGFYDLFYPALLSCRIGASKPDAKAYCILLDELQLPPQAVLFVDNKLANVKAAKRLGIDAILFTDPLHFIEELKQRGIQVSPFSPTQAR